MTAFDLGRILYEARIREAWNFGGPYPQRRLDQYPYPRHEGEERAAEVELAIAQARALLKARVVVLDGAALA